MTFSKSDARRYARAIADAAPAAELREVASELSGFARSLAGSPDLARALRNPALPVERKQALVEAVLAADGARPLVQKAAALIVAQGHAHGIPAIAEALVEEAARALGIVRAVLRSAQPLSEGDVTRITAALSQAVGRQVEVETRIDPALIGGFVAQAGDLVFNGSVAHELERLRSRLTQEEKR